MAQAATRYGRASAQRAVTQARESNTMFAEVICTGGELNLSADWYTPHACQLQKMSDAEEDVSDVELDDDFDDFDPLAESDGDDDAAAPGDADDDSVDEGESDDDAKADDDAGDDAGDDALSAPAGPRKRVRRRDAPARQAAQAVDTRRVIVVASEDRLSSNMMTLAETTRAIAVRAKQISTHPYAYTDVGDLSDAMSIARKELFDRRSPLVLRRPMGRTLAGETIIELWCVREMSYPPLN